MSPSPDLPFPDSPADASLDTASADIPAPHTAPSAAAAYPDSDSSVVLITGASSGIGRATALRLADQHASLVLVGRSATTLGRVAQDCRDRGATVTVVEADVADEAAMEAMVERAVAAYGRLDVCVHSAAVVGYGRFEDVPAEVFKRVIETDVIGTANVARSVLNLFRQQQKGNLILLGSILGRIRTPYMSPYVTSKAAVHALARVLTIENRDLADVHVCLLMPGSVDTPVYRRAANYTGQIGKPPPPVISADKVARAVLGLIERPRARVDVGPANKLMALGFGLFPQVFDVIVTPMMKVLSLGKPLAPHDGNVFEATRATDVDGETYTDTQSPVKWIPPPLR